MCRTVNPRASASRSTRTVMALSSPASRGVGTGSGRPMALGPIAIPDLGQGGDAPELTPAPATAPAWTSDDGRARPVRRPRPPSPLHRRNDDDEPGAGARRGAVDRSLHHGRTVLPARRLPLAAAPHQPPDAGFDGLGLQLTAGRGNSATTTPRSTTAGPVDSRRSPRGALDHHSQSILPIRLRAFAWSGSLGGAPGLNAQFMAELRDACAAAGAEFQRDRHALTAGPRARALRPLDSGRDRVRLRAEGPDRALDQSSCDGPRNRPLDRFAERELLGLDFREWSRGSSSHLGIKKTSRLDSFGNLEVSPPVHGRGRPPTRSAGSSSGRSGPGRPCRGTSPTARRRSALRRLPLRARRCRRHSRSTPTGFSSATSTSRSRSYRPRASRASAYSSPPPGDAGEFSPPPDRALGRADYLARPARAPATAGDAEETVDELLAEGRPLVLQRRVARAMLRGAEAERRRTRLCGTSSSSRSRALRARTVRAPGAYFPDMVNDLVLGQRLVVPRPYGPLKDGTDLLEQAFRDAVPAQEVHFVDDWLSYHEHPARSTAGRTCSANRSRASAGGSMSTTACTTPCLRRTRRGFGLLRPEQPGARSLPIRIRCGWSPTGISRPPSRVA